MTAPTYEPKNPGYAERVRSSFERQPFMALIGAELTEIAPGRCEIQLPCRPDLAQQHGFVHGGALGGVIDSAMGYAGYSLAPAGASVLTVEYKINLVAPADGERIIARGRVVRAGRTLTVTRGDAYALKDGVETLCATAQQTLMILADTPDKPC